MTSIVSWQTTSPEQLLNERFHLTNGFHAGQREIIEQRQIHFLETPC